MLERPLDINPGVLLALHGYTVSSMCLTKNVGQNTINFCDHIIGILHRYINSTFLRDLCEMFEGTAYSVKQ